MARGGLPAPRRADPWPAGTWRALDDAFEREARRATRVRCPCRVRLRSRRFSRRRAVTGREWSWSGLEGLDPRVAWWAAASHDRSPVPVLFVSWPPLGRGTRSRVSHRSRSPRWSCGRGCLLGSSRVGWDREAPAVEV